MYRLCKVHKGITPNDSVPPYRPILSAIGTCSYNLEKFLVPLQKQSFFFVKKLLIQTLNLASFDIQSLFTNIPLDGTIDICVDMVYNKRKKVKGMLKRHFKQLLTLSVKSSFFVFNGVCYRQIDGVAALSFTTNISKYIFILLGR